MGREWDGGREREGEREREREREREETHTYVVEGERMQQTTHGSDLSNDSTVFAGNQQDFYSGLKHGDSICRKPHRSSCPLYVWS